MHPAAPVFSRAESGGYYQLFVVAVTVRPAVRRADQSHGRLASRINGGVPRTAGDRGLRGRARRRVVGELDGRRCAVGGSPEAPARTEHCMPQAVEEDRVGGRYAESFECISTKIFELKGDVRGFGVPDNLRVILCV